MFRRFRVSVDILVILQFAETIGYMALGLRHASGEMVAAPHKDTALRPGGSLFGIGAREAVAALSGAKLKVGETEMSAQPTH